MVPTDFSIGVMELGRATEEREFESLFLPEHTHIPASRRTPWPAGGELPEEYRRTLDPFVALGAVAATTRSLLLGTGVCLVVERDPITLAKEVASLDRLSGGRVLFGVGAGWNHEEMRNHGTDPTLRWKLLRERVLAMKQIWIQDVAEFHGEFVDFDALWQWPKPIQTPHPPVLIAGNGPRVLERVVEFGDAWLTMPKEEPHVLGRRIGELQDLATRRGRGPVPVTVFGAPPDPDALEIYAESGVSRCLFWLPSAPAAEVLPILDRLAILAGKFPDDV